MCGVPVGSEYLSVVPVSNEYLNVVTGVCVVRCNLTWCAGVVADV